MATTMDEPGETTEKPRDTRGMQVLLFFFLFSFTVGSLADEFRLAPYLNLKETYTDNVLLNAGVTDVSSFITEVTPGIGVTANGPSFKAHLNYAVQLLDFSGQAHKTETNQFLAANAKEEFVKDTLYMENSANISQVYSSPFTTVSNDNLNLSSNRMEVRTYNLQPYFQTRLTDNASAELRFTHNSVTTSNGGLIDSDANTVNAILKSGSAFKTVDWSLQYSDQKINYQSNSDLEMENTTFNGGYHVTSEMELTASVGYEKNNYLVSDGKKPEGDDWSAGFKWTPTSRTLLDASFGRHYYGNTYALTASERTRATVWSLGYSDTLMTSRGEFLIPVSTDTFDFLNALWQSSIPDPTQRQLAIEAFIQNAGLPASLPEPVNTLTENVFLQKRLQGSMGLSGKRNIVMLSVFNVRRINQSLDPLATPSPSNLLNNTTQTGANLMWNVKFTPRTNAVFSTSHTKTTSNSADITVSNNTLTTSLNHQWRPKLHSTLQYQHVQSKSNLVPDSTKVNSLSFLLAFQF